MAESSAVRVWTLELEDDPWCMECGEPESELLSVHASADSAMAAARHVVKRGWQPTPGSDRWEARRDGRHGGPATYLVTPHEVNG